MSILLYTIGAFDASNIKHDSFVGTNDSFTDIINNSNLCNLKSVYCLGNNVSVFNGVTLTLEDFCASAGYLFSTVAKNCFSTDMMRSYSNFTFGGEYFLVGNVTCGSNIIVLGGNAMINTNCLYVGLGSQNGSGANYVPDISSAFNTINKGGALTCLDGSVWHGMYYDSVYSDVNTAWVTSSGGYVGRIDYAPSNYNGTLSLFYVPNTPNINCSCDCKFPKSYAIDFKDVNNGAVSIISSDSLNGLYIITNGATTPVFTKVAGTNNLYITGIKCATNGDVIFTAQDGIYLYSGGTLSSLYSYSAFTLTDVCNYSVASFVNLITKVSLSGVKGKDVAFIRVNDGTSSKVLKVSYSGTWSVVNTNVALSPSYGLVTAYDGSTFGVQNGSILTYYTFSSGTSTSIGTSNIGRIPTDLDTCPIPAPKIPGYILTNCLNEQDVLYSTQDLSEYVGKIVTLKNCYGNCYTVNTIPDVTGKTLTTVVISNVYTDCNTCLGINIIPPAVFKLKRESYKPGLFINNCDINLVEDVNESFGNVWYKEMMQRRYGLKYCCFVDFNKWYIKKSKLDLELLKNEFECCPVLDCVAPCIVVTEPSIMLACMKPDVSSVVITNLCGNLPVISSVILSE